tara:strand:- start:2389 stop:2532 length:144 start_codon:yes stop_codon:yes gene_type:complete
MKRNFKLRTKEKPLEQRKKELLERVEKNGSKLEFELYLKSKKENKDQ